MEYHREVLDRTTGRLETKSIGDWIPVTELGAQYGVGRKQVRAILHHMGVLAQEGQTYRLPFHLMDAGIGIRHDKPRSGYAFDVISPKGQALIASVWSETVADYEADRQKAGGMMSIAPALEAFRKGRNRELTPQESVCWILDRFENVSLNAVAAILEVSPALVTRYAKKRAKDRGYWERRKKATLSETRAGEQSPSEYRRPDDRSADDAGMAWMFPVYY